MSHPLKQKFSPRLLAKYPQYDYPDEDSFPSYIPMFCFPNDIMIKESEDCPPATFHGFVMTQEDGTKRYGVCLTTYYAPLPDHLIEELEILHKKWCEANMAPSELEYIKHLLEKVRQERRRVETAKATLSLQRSSNTTMGDKNDELDEILKEKADAEDKLDLYLQLLEPIKLGVFDSTKLWLPKAIGIVSHFPWHDILKDWLCAVVMPMVDSLKENNHNQLKTRLPLERYIVNLVHEIPLPPPGKAQVAISVNDMTLFCSRPALNQKPILKDYSLYPLFRSLSFNTIMTLFEVALSEGKILLISSFPDMLYLVAHSITYLLYPFYWQGVFIPVLPARLMACLQAPVPYIMGIERQYKGMDLLPEDACIVDIDRDTVLIAEQPIQIPPRQRKKLLQSLGSYVPLHQSNHHNHPHYSVPYGIPLYIQQAYPNNRFTPHHTSTRSKIGDERSGNSISKIGSVVGRPAQPISLAPLMSKFQKLEIDPQAQAQFDEHLASLNKISNNNNGNNANHTNNNNNNLLNVLNNNNKFGRASESIINNTNSLQKRFSNFNPSFDKFGENRDEIMHLNPDKHPKRIKNRFSSITGGARNSIISIRNKALARNSVFGVNKIVTPLKISHTAPSSIDIRLSPPQLSMSSSSEATSNSSIDNLSLFDDGMSVMSVLTESEQRVLPEKNYIPKEGHLMAQILNDDDDEQFTGKCGMNILIFEGIACGICNESLGINLIYKCEGCSMMIHEECLSDIVYPCVPACFNEAKVQDAFLRVFSSFLQNYRSFMLNNNDNSNDGPINNYSRSGESNEFLDDSEVFNKDLFLKSVDRESKPFLSQLVDSQAFSQFINQRVNAKKTSVRDYDVQYFDEVIKAKLNRSKLRFSKESTTFLDDSTYAISQTIRSMKPNEEGLEEQDFEGYIHLPDSFDHGIMNNPRPIKKVWL